jgi:SPP1 family predicted phage head-tail adaptor
MDAGSLNSRVTLQSLPDTADAIGQPSQTWVDVATVWGNVRYLNGVETVKAGALTSVTQVSIRIRPRAVSTEMRVKVGTTNFQIRKVLRDEIGNDFIDLACEAIDGR